MSCSFLRAIQTFDALLPPSNWLTGIRLAAADTLHCLPSSDLLNSASTQTMAPYL